jgi:hypothetical protein
VGRLSNLGQRWHQVFNSTSLDRLFLAIQTWLFGLLAVGAVGNAAIGISQGLGIGQALADLGNTMAWWLAIAAAIAVLWYVVVKGANLDLWWYYYVWILRLFPLLTRWVQHGGAIRRGIARAWFTQYSNVERQRLEDIKESLESAGAAKRPVFVRREHLMRKNYWPDWEFAIITIFDEKVKVCSLRGGAATHWQLELDLREESFGIYSNAGKRFLHAKFGASNALAGARTRAQTCHEQLLAKKAPMSFTWGGHQQPVPLRWASGGFLPMVRYQNRYWSMLLFRSILPVGWNVPNGASETKEEYKDLNRLIIREFSEEVILLDRRPEPGGNVTQIPFCCKVFHPGGSPTVEYFSPDFAAQHRRLRYEHDNVSIKMEPGCRRQIEPLRTPFVAKVTHHLPNLKEPRTTECHDVVFSLNPGEFGIEAIWLCTFSLDDGEYLVDGEVGAGYNMLIRSPVLLLDIEFLRNVYELSGSLGCLVTGDAESPDCKRLPVVPRQHYVLFDADIELRQRRLKQLEDRLRTCRSTRGRAVLKRERNMIREWLEQYACTFRKAAEQGGCLDHEALRTLCPVTWKTLELFFAHSIKLPK